MISLLAIGAVVLLIWVGRKGLPRVRKLQQWRVAGGGLAALALLGGAAAAMRGAWMVGGGLLVLGLGLAMSARVKLQPRQPAISQSDTEARSILGVGPDADAAEIQAAYSRLIRMAHPDKGGTSGLAAQLNAARDQLLERR